MRIRREERLKKVKCLFVYHDLKKKKYVDIIWIILYWNRCNWNFKNENGFNTHSALSEQETIILDRIDLVRLRSESLKKYDGSPLTRICGFCPRSAEYDCYRGITAIHFIWPSTYYPLRNCHLKVDKRIRAPIKYIDKNHKI